MYCVIGDIHGNFNKLEALLELVYKDDKATAFYHLGDIIDRGDDSKKVVDLCIQYDITGLIGNHELWILNLIDWKIFDDFCLTNIMGGRATLRSYGVSPSDIETAEKGHWIPKKHADYFRTLKSHIWLDDMLLTHAGISETGWKYRKENEDPYVFIEEKGIHSEEIYWGGGKPAQLPFIQFRGHAPQLEANRQGNVISLDTGCSTCNPYKLSACLWEPGSRDFRFISV